MEKVKSSSANTFRLEEDWAVVVTGFLIIAASVFVFTVPAPSLGWTGGDFFEKIFTTSNSAAIVATFVVTYMTGAFTIILAGKQLRNFLIVFPVVFLLSLVALILAGNSAVKELNLEAVIFSLTLGLLVGNLVKLPTWFREALSAELFVKIGLVLLGTGVIFGDILKAGSLGLIQAMVVVFSVWYSAYWICKALKLDEELSMMLSSAVSICGVSAAIATAGAIKGDSKKLSYVISLVLITAIPMMILMPYAAKAMGLSQEVTGAWLGGTIDTTGAVVASGTLVGETALKISTIVKFSQNVLLGIAAFIISIYWTYKKDASASSDMKPGLGVIWQRFPKFVIGFIVASLIFSFLLSTEQVTGAKDGLKSIQTTWFVLAFTSIGLETNFSDLFSKQGSRPAIAFVAAQSLNIVITLVIAYVLFG